MEKELITESARRSFDIILERAVQLRLKQSTDDRVVISELAWIDEQRSSAPELIVVTIASITFRMLLILQIDETPATRRYFLGDDAERPFEDAVSELANLCGGVINQELLTYFPDLGMSTPYRLDAPCLQYLQALAPQYRKHFSIVIDAADGSFDGAADGGAVACMATLCVSANAPIDFAAAIDVAAVDTGGELEFF